jgi:hypothetical protein
MDFGLAKLNERCLRILTDSHARISYERLYHWDSVGTLGNANVFKPPVFVRDGCAPTARCRFGILDRSDRCSV